MMAATISSSPELLRFCSLSNDAVTALVTAPTPSLVQTLLSNISSKLQEQKQEAAEWLKSKVQLETALNRSDAQNRNLKASLDKAKSDATELRTRLEEAEKDKDLLKEEFQTHKESHSDSQGTLADLNARIQSLEASNRDKLALLDAKTTSYDNLVTDLNSQHQKTLELRKQLSVSEQALEEQKSALSAANYREQSLRQSQEQLERRNEYLDGELKAKANDLTKLRKDRNQEIAKLDRQNEEAGAELRQLKGVETTLRRTIDELNEKAEERSLRVDELQQQFLQKETSFQLEIDAANRLAKLREESSRTDRQRVRDLTEELEEHRRRNENEFSRLQAELETEHTGLEEAETKIAELEVQIERLTDEIHDLKAREQFPETPSRPTHHLPSPDHARLSPGDHSPGSVRSKGGLSVTRLYSENNDLKRQVAAERRKNEELSGAMTNLVADMEAQAPEIEDLKTEHARLENEVSDLSMLLDSAGSERDEALKATKKLQSDVEAKIRESEILRQQLRDLSSQIKLLLMESQLRDQGRQHLEAEERAQVEKFARYASEADADGLTDTDKYISENLVQFRNIKELQEQNSSLLKLTRELGDRMEQEETLRSQNNANRNWDELNQKYERCKEEMKALITQSQSYIRERDMFRTIVENRGHSARVSEFPANESQAMSASQAQILDSVENGSADTATDYAKLIKDLQAHFDAYREEAATDRASLKRENDDLIKARSEMRSEVARSSSQAMLSRDRYEMLQTNFDLLKKENAEMQKRFQESFESSAKQDLRVQQTAEDLVETRGLADSLRNENANLRAEKDFWKTVETRLNEDNNNLVQERSRLSTLNASLQSLLNEREHSDGEVRRRLQAQIDGLEKDVQSTKAQLHAKEEEFRQLASRREFDNGENHTKITDLMSRNATLKEELAKANTAKDHLARQVQQLNIELQGAREQVAALQFRPQSNGPDVQSSAEDSTSISSEQQLRLEISGLNEKLGHAKTEIDDIKTQVEQYKAISQESEEELESLNRSHDLYREEMDGLLKNRNLEIRNHEQRIKDLSDELANLGTELEQLRTKENAHDRDVQEQRRSFETELAKLKDEDERHAAAAQYYQQDLKAQAEIAQQAQQNYENELVKHADAAKAVQKARSDLNAIRTELVSANSEAQTARLNQAQSEQSWAEAKAGFEMEIGEIRSAREDLKTQNDILHQQIETLSKAHKRTDSDAVGGEGAISSPSNNLQEVITYLRREKDIVDVQFELASQEAKRLKQQLDHSQSQLDDARLKLQQRARMETEAANSALAQSKLIETVQDLNTHREANVTLRAEARLAQTRLTARTEEVEELKAQIEPLQIQVQEYKLEREALADEIKLQKESADRWQQRAQNVLQKYDRIDPAEMEALKQKMVTVETERDELMTRKDQLETKVQEATAQIDQAQSQSDKRVEDLKARLGEQFKARSKAQSDKIKEKDNQLQAVMLEKQSLESRLAQMTDLQDQLDTAKSERDIALAELAQSRPIPDTDGSKGNEEGEIDDSVNADRLQKLLETAQTNLEAAEARAEQEKEKSESLQSQLNATRDRVAELDALVVSLPAALHNLVDSEQTSLQEEITNLKQSPPTAASTTDATDVQTAENDNEQITLHAPIKIVLSEGTDTTSSKSLADQVLQHAETARQDLQRRYDQRMHAMEVEYKNRLDKMRAQLNEKLAQSRSRVRDAALAEQEGKIQEMKSQHENELARLVEQHKTEIAELKQKVLPEEGQPVPEDSKPSESSANKDTLQSDTAEKPPTTDGNHGPGPGWSPSDEEARAYVSSNEVFKKLLKSNILLQVNKQKEALAKKKDEEFSKAMAEAQSKATTAKEHAVMMEAKKNNLQLNMANNKAKLAQFRLDGVQNAAQGTPQKPVGEVWDSIKDSKPPQPAKQATQLGGTSTVPQPTNATLLSVPTTAKLGDQATSALPAAAQPTLPADSAVQSSESTSTTVNGDATQKSEKDLSSTATSTASNIGAQRQAASGIPQAQQPSLQQAGSRIPTTTPAARGSGLPVARGAGARGIPRGRGSGIGRGGPGIDTGRGGASARGRGSPTRGAFNPAVQQFVPGNKRPREDSQDGGDGPGKKIRGGAAES